MPAVDHTIAPAPAPPRPRMLRTLVVGAVAGSLVGLAIVSGLAMAGRANGATGPATATSGAGIARDDSPPSGNPVTPGDFTGFGFDQCETPSQAVMDQWLQNSPFLAVGIYISGNSRACRDQPNLDAQWVTTQLAEGWKLLPITLGPQASCQPRFPRYTDDPTIIPKPGPNGGYAQAGAQGRAEAQKTVGVAQQLGITAGSTLWYDLEGFDDGNTDCRESALRFLSAWTDTIHSLGYVSGIYSSAGSGIADLDQVRSKRPTAYTLPDQVWIARWDGKATVTTPYLSNDGWMPHARVKQYQGGHDETWGTAPLNIDRDYLDVGQGTVAAPEAHCGATRVSFPDYPIYKPPSGTTVPDPKLTRGLKCLLQEQGLYHGPINGTYGSELGDAIEAWRAQHGLPAAPTFTRKAWMTLLAVGTQPALKIGSGGPDVRRLQRTLNAVSPLEQITVSGLFGSNTDLALRAYQAKYDLPVTGVSSTVTWEALAAGTR